VAPPQARLPVIAALSLSSLAVLGAIGGQLAGAPKLRAAVRVMIGGALAMAATALIGRLFGVATSMKGP
jgi:VIT1/CCC1 family predicted Fe2+/Mn2+ transporter